MELKKGLYRIDEILWKLLDDDIGESDKVLLQEGRGLIHTLVENLALSDVVVPKGTLYEHNNCSWDKDPNKLKCLNCGEEISRA
jgi:hypothetical protein